MTPLQPEGWERVLPESQSFAGIALDQDMELLRRLLLAPEIARIAALEQQLAALQVQLSSHASLLALLRPVIGQALAQEVQESRDEIAVALYPVIGQSIALAVSAAMRDLAERIDRSMRQSGPLALLERIRLRLRRVSPAEATLRDALPFAPQHILLLQREGGLLLLDCAATDQLPDADLIGGMLVAIRAYVKDSFQPHASGSLDTIRYGDLTIMIEDGSAVVLAAVCSGIPPGGYRDRMRQQLSALHANFGNLLSRYQGDALPTEQIRPLIAPLLEVHRAAA